MTMIIYILHKIPLTITPSFDINKTNKMDQQNHNIHKIHHFIYIAS